jgi:hypothetical protein
VTLAPGQDLGLSFAQPAAVMAGPQSRDNPLVSLPTMAA